MSADALIDGDTLRWTRPGTELALWSERLRTSTPDERAPTLMAMRAMVAR